MTSPVTAIWLAIVGLAYAGIGVVLIATALKSSALIAGSSRAVQSRHRANEAFASFGALLAVIGFFPQAVGQFRSIELGPVVVALMVGLIALLALFAMADFSTPSTRDHAETPSATVAAAHPVNRGPSPPPWHPPIRR